MRLALNFKVLFVSLLLLIGALFSLANIDVWVPEKLIKQAEKDYNRRAGQRIRDWRSLMSQASALTEKQKLKAVNRFFNQSIPYREDSSHWKRVDYWATPYEALGTNGGDCEDYVIAKYYSLIMLGIDTSKLRITYVQALKLNQAHMVLAYFPEPDSVPLVLDNLTSKIKPANERKDLHPVYSFNANGLWLEKMKGKGVLMGNPNKLDLWTSLRVRMNQLGMDI